MMTMKKPSITSTQPTAGQWRQIHQTIKAAATHAGMVALKKGGVDRAGMQILLGRGDELQQAIAEAAAAAVKQLSMVNQFTNEEVASKYGYLSGYTGPKTLSEQVAKLRELFPQLTSVDLPQSGIEHVLPEGAEGLFAIPDWYKIAPTYYGAVQIVLDLLAKACGGNFKNWRQGEMDRLRQSTKSVALWNKVSASQNGNDILVVDAQFGLLHRGRSVRRAREVMWGNQCGLGAFAVGIMLLTHVNRLQQFNDLWVDCAGDEFLGDGALPLRAPCFGWDDGGLRFGADSVGLAIAGYGSASFFLPQS